MACVILNVSCLNTSEVGGHELFMVVGLYQICFDMYGLLFVLKRVISQFCALSSSPCFYLDLFVISGQEVQAKRN